MVTETWKMRTEKARGGGDDDDAGLWTCCCCPQPLSLT